ncbi:hypothetical protein ACFL42_02800 [Candidatus Omnitrophota bacterium]
MSRIEIAASLPPVAPRNDEKTLPVPRNDKVLDENIKKLLDIVASIIADEYIRVARENKDVFSPSP